MFTQKLDLSSEFCKPYQSVFYRSAPKHLYPAELCFEEWESLIVFVNKVHSIVYVCQLFLSEFVVQTVMSRCSKCLVLFRSLHFSRKCRSSWSHEFYGGS